MYRQGQGIETSRAYSSMTMTQNTRSRQQRSGSRRSTWRSWSGLASLQTLIPWKICGSSWRFELPNVSLEILMTWRRSAKRSGIKSLLRCVQTWWPTARNIWPLWWPTGVLPPSTKSCFCEWVKYFFHSLKCKSIYNFFEMRFYGFCCYSVSHCSNKPTSKIIDWSILCQWENIQNQQGFFFPHYKEIIKLGWYDHMFDLVRTFGLTLACLLKYVVHCN